MGYHGIAWYIIVSQWINTKLVLIILTLCSYFVLIKYKYFLARFKRILEKVICQLVCKLGSVIENDNLSRPIVANRLKQPTQTTHPRLG
jgi:hypothetical protein